MTDIKINQEDDNETRALKDLLNYGDHKKDCDRSDELPSEACSD